jgi:hypothetical protein
MIGDQSLESQSTLILAGRRVRHVNIKGRGPRKKTPNEKT